MKIRLMGSADLIEHCRGLLSIAGLDAQSYPNRPPSTDLRLYCDVDDRRMAEMLASFESRDSQRNNPKSSASPPRSRSLKNLAGDSKPITENSSGGGS